MAPLITTSSSAETVLSGKYVIDYVSVSGMSDGNSVILKDKDDNEVATLVFDGDIRPIDGIIDGLKITAITDGTVYVVYR